MVIWPFSPSFIPNIHVALVHRRDNTVCVENKPFIRLFFFTGRRLKTGEIKWSLALSLTRAQRRKSNETSTIMNLTNQSKLRLSNKLVMSTQHTMFDAVERAHKRGGQICAWLPWSQWANYHSHTIMLWREFILWIHGDELLFLLSKEKNDSKPSLFHYLFLPGPIATNVFHWTDSAAETITKSTLWPGWKNRMNTPSLQPNYRKSSVSLWVLSWWIEAISNFFFSFFLSRNSFLLDATFILLRSTRFRKSNKHKPKF